jgi:hypothetical protein
MMQVVFSVRYSSLQILDYTSIGYQTMYSSYLKFRVARQRKSMIQVVFSVRYSSLQILDYISIGYRTINCSTRSSRRPGRKRV